MDKKEDGKEFSDMLRRREIVLTIAAVVMSFIGATRLVFSSFRLAGLGMRRLDDLGWIFLGIESFSAGVLIHVMITQAVELYRLGTRRGK